MFTSNNFIRYSFHLIKNINLTLDFTLSVFLIYIVQLSFANKYFTQVWDFACHFYREKESTVNFTLDSFVWGRDRCATVRLRRQQIDTSWPIYCLSPAIFLHVFGCRVMAGPLLSNVMA